MVDRIIELMKQKNLTPSQFADEIGIQRSGMSHLLSGRNKPSLEFVLKVLNRFPDIKPDFLLLGSTRMHGEGSGSVHEVVVEPGTATTPGLPEATLFDPWQEPLPERERAQKTPVAPRKDRNERSIEKIVVFYNDQTFRVYMPG